MTTPHVAILGKTGMGKSSLLRATIIDAMRNGQGLLLLDPHGDLADEVKANVPRYRKNDLVFFDPRDPERCPGLNPIRNVPLASRSVIVASVLATMKKIWADGGIGPRSEHLLRYAFLALCEVRGATLLDARDMLVDDRYRAWALRQVRDEDTARFWSREFTAYSRQLQSEAVAAPANKLGALAGHACVRAILRKDRSVIDPEKCMASGRIVVARLSKGTLGEDGALLLGGLLLGVFQHATMARESLPLQLRRPFLILVDEIHAFATRPFVQLLAECRKYAVTVHVATQSLAVMEKELRAGILGNVGRLIAFRVSGGEDAELLQKEFAGRFGPKTLMSLDVGERIVKVGGSDARIESDSHA